MVTGIYPKGRIFSKPYQFISKNQTLKCIELHDPYISQFRLFDVKIPFTNDKANKIGCVNFEQDMCIM